jgi:sulfate transport system ATP-binding protein
MSITITNLSKCFGGVQVLNEVSLQIRDGELLALLGPSGSGKTTLLRIIAGLETADSGSLLYRGEEVSHRSARDRNVGFVFQHYALFRHMTVFENVAFGLRVRKAPEARVRRRVGELLELIRLNGFERRFPSELSGGQRQRVALARALAAEPHVLLLDEPFGALDAKVRQELRQWLRHLHDELHVASVFVTHDQEEAFEVADRVAVLRGGRIEQVGTPKEVFDHPVNAFVMDFLGSVNVFHGRVRNGCAILGDVEFPNYDQVLEEDELAKVYVRPHELDIEPSHNGASGVAARVLHVNPAGSVARVRLVDEATESLIHAEISPQRHAVLNLKTGDRVRVVPRRVRVFAAEPEYMI